MALNNLILKELNGIYKFLNNAAPIIQKKNNNLFLHDKQRYNMYKKTSKKTFVGELSCGVCSFLLNYYLKKIGVENKIMKTTFGYGKYLEDHCFLMHGDIIIDPTYRQMILGYSRNDDYSKYVFEKNSFIFVGNYNQLENHFEELSYLYKKNYKIDNLRENLIFWQNSEEVKRCKKYAINKGENYLKLHKYLNNLNYNS